MILIHIPWEPVPWSAPRLGKYGCYDKREADKRAIRYLVKEQYTGPILDEYVSIQFFFGFSIPLSASKKKRAQMLNREIIPTRCDCTNLQKLFEDCMKGIVFKDDRLVERIASVKMYEAKPFMHAVISTRNTLLEDAQILQRICQCG